MEVVVEMQEVVDRVEVDLVLDWVEEGQVLLVERIEERVVSILGGAGIA